MAGVNPFILALLAFGLLVAALAAFLLSTRQMRLPIRAGIWAFGAASLGAALCVIASRPEHIGLLRAIAEAGAANALLGHAISNWRTVADAVAPMFDAFWIFGVVMALLALIALTPGELVERFTRPLIYATAGACVGGFVALALVATGFGGYQKREVYFAVLGEDNVVDGDTLEIGDFRFRLAGMDAPERGQVCLRGTERVECGKQARERLVRLVEGELVICQNPALGLRPVEESFGRPIVSCTIVERGRPPTSLDRAMIENGFAVPYTESEGDKPQAAVRRDEGVWGTCYVDPDVWRGESAVRRAFRSSEPLPAGVDAMGVCAQSPEAARAQTDPGR